MARGTAWPLARCRAFPRKGFARAANPLPLSDAVLCRRAWTQRIRPSRNCRMAATRRWGTRRKRRRFIPIVVDNPTSPARCSGQEIMKGANMDHFLRNFVKIHASLTSRKSIRPIINMNNLSHNFCIFFAILVFCAFLDFARPSIADVNQEFSELDRRLTEFGCDHDRLRAEMIGSDIILDYVAVFDSPLQRGTMRRYRWSNHETNVIGPDEDPDLFWRWYVIKTIVSGSRLPRGFEMLNSAGARQFLLSAGFERGFHDSRYSGVEIYSRYALDSNRGDDSYTATDIVYYAGLVSTINWYCHRQGG